LSAIYYRRRRRGRRRREELNSSCGENMVDNFHLINPKTHFDIEIEGFLKTIKIIFIFYF
jgi:hypothetical protein